MKRIITTVVLFALTGTAQAQGAELDAGVASAEAASADSVASPEVAPPAPPLGEQAAPVSEPPAEMAQLSEAELEALGFGGGEQTQAVDTDIKVFGFADFGTAVPLVKKSSPWYGSYFDKHRSLYVGNFNLYMSKNLTDKVRTMGEVRFLYLPHGAQDPSTGAITSTVTNDYADFNRPLRWGGIEIERIYLEWSALRYLTIRAGQFLTPYGIWNVDHGSPTFIPVQRPYVVGSNWFPERQTGFELYGKVDARANQTVGYHLTLSNGQGLTSEYRDLDSNKAMGARAFWEWRGVGDLRIGVSGYYGKNTDAITVPGLGNGRVSYSERIQTQYTTLALAMDALWKYKGLRLQLEILNQQVNYTDAGRVQVTSTLTGATNFPVDLRSWGGYFLAGYRFEWFGVMPYGVIQYIDQVTPATGLITKIVSYEAGLNVRAIDAVVVKLSYAHATFIDGMYISDGPIRMLQAQVAWAF